MSKSVCGRWRGAWARAEWRVWDLDNDTIMLHKLFNPEWQITSKSFLLSSFLIGFSFHQPWKFSGYDLSFKKVVGLFPHWSLGWYICYLKTQITVIKEKRRVCFFINRLDLVTSSWRGTWLFRLSSRSNAFLDEILRLNETLFLPLRTTRRGQKGLDFGGAPLDFLSSFPKINLRCGTSRLKCIC